MSHQSLKVLAILGIILGLTVIISACSSTEAQAPPQTEVVSPKVVITQFVTQVVATPTITPIPAPTQVAKVTVPALSTGWDPSTLPIYYPIRSCVASRLYVGDVAFVSNGSIGLHMSKDTGDSPIFRNLEAGELVDIIKGPWCTNLGITWKVAAEDGYLGFVLEGNGESYWLLPMPEDTDNVLSKEEIKYRETYPVGSPAMRITGPKDRYCR